ncbi:putative acyl-CoA oxidase [Rosa chinensis]|uniref:Putative acyl-CoA oxidase n=1 Tax=Rosa chinensis TaxID=74649 RepID=A0A2P6PPQ3_ROSCH|nr:putative acyl-CoA oxidase [Rosa chinensis]
MNHQFFRTLNNIEKNVLATLRTLYALSCLEEVVAFLRYGYLSIDNVAAIRKEVSRLYRELRPHALALIISFK